jgi:DNA-binding response OmpR family regulator
MKKILIAINNDFILETYSQLFMERNFEISKTKDGDEALKLFQKENPDIVLADTVLPKLNGFELLKKIRQINPYNRKPVIIYSQLEKMEDRIKAIDLEANDFVTAAATTPAEVVRRVMIILGEQKSYRIMIQKNLYNAKELITDFGYTYDLKCPKCGNDLILYLIRDLSKGEDYFKISFICPDCDYRP